MAETATQPRRPKVEPPTRWYGWITNYRDVQRTTSCGSSSVRGDTLAEFMADIVRQATFSLSLHDYPARSVTGMERVCARCDGDGSIKVKGRGGYKPKRCPACKGFGMFERIGDFPIECHSNAQVVPDYYVATDPYAKATDTATED